LDYSIKYTIIIGNIFIRAAIFDVNGKFHVKSGENPLPEGSLLDLDFKAVLDDNINIIYGFDFRSHNFIGAKI